MIENSSNRGQRKNALPVFISLTILLSIGLTYFSGSFLFDHRVKTSTLLYAPPYLMKQFTFGYSDTIADTLWIRLIQDFDLCEQNLAPKDQSVRTGPNRVANCKMGWAYHMLDAITELAPHWRHPALVGPLFLSILVDDIQGASALFRKVLKVFSSDWMILFRAGYHFLYEEQDYVYAAQLYEAAGRNGAPDWVPALAGKLYSESGRNIIARSVLIDALHRTPPGKLRDRIVERLKKIEATIKLNNGASDVYTKSSLEKAIENSKSHEDN